MQWSRYIMIMLVICAGRCATSNRGKGRMWRLFSRRETLKWNLQDSPRATSCIRFLLPQLNLSFLESAKLPAAANEIDGAYTSEHGCRERGLPISVQDEPRAGRPGAKVGDMSARSSTGLMKSYSFSHKFKNMEVGMPSAMSICRKLSTVEPRTLDSERSLAVTSSPGKEISSKPKRKKLKGKRAVVRWLKFFRWRKKKEYSRMTAEEKILYKLRKAKKKEARLAEALKKIEPSEEAGEITHDPEVLTPEEHFHLLKMGRKSKNYVPVGRRGIFQGVILNMHLHWKKHQTLKVIVKTFTPPEVKGIAAELARMTGGIVLEIQEEDDTIIMYRGKNYVQPPTEIMSPRATLTRKKALDKSKYMDAFRAVQKYIPRLEEDMESLKIQAKAQAEIRDGVEISPSRDSDHSENLTSEDEMISDSEDLSDVFDVEGSEEEEVKGEDAGKHRNLYLDQIDGFFEDENQDREPVLSLERNRKEEEFKEVDEIDRMFLQATLLLKRRGRGKK